MFASPMCITDEFTAAGVSKKGQHSAQFARSFFALLSSHRMAFNICVDGGVFRLAAGYATTYSQSSGGRQTAESCARIRNFLSARSVTENG
jgi:hypothetical protein